MSFSRLRLAAAALALALVAGLALLVLEPRELPCTVDFDSASIGIFVNDLAWRERFDETFAGSRHWQDRYRVGWAAYLLPVSVPLAAIARLAALRPEQTDLLLDLAAAALAVLGAVCAAAALLRSRDDDLEGRAFVASIGCSGPIVVLFVRTGFLSALIPFALFWATAACVLRYLDRGSRGAIWGAGALLGAFALVPYPPLLALPIAAVGFAAARGRLRAALRDPHLYGAGLLGIAAWGSTRWLLAATYVGSWSRYRELVGSFLEARGSAIGSSQLALPPWPRLEKLWHQHVTFHWDELGDPSRSDWIWTLHGAHPAWWLVLALAGLGAWLAAARRERARADALIVLASFAIVFLTVSFPEGRYVLAAVPCYAALAERGVRRLVPSRTARRSVFAALLLATAFVTHSLLDAHERALITHDGPCRDWWALAAALGRHPGERVVLAGDSPHPYDDSLALRMAANRRVDWVDHDELARRAGRPNPPGVRLVALAPEGSTRWQELGFARAGEVRLGAYEVQVLWIR